ncbi:hypothetical protein R3W88_026603 [Solanum pinnatisectum]|uniref:Ubiquitin-like protease family profile domain-containing protein n=1 Tax=Solanum pinnatisectum TaxID=50273 RepID=A0AAV9LEP9_9SOLN|nr:hypothetical protein R3W88_026603 [Solanum pinnatisectum]
MPSKIFQSPYLTEFGSSDKGKQKFEEEVHPSSLFDGCDISYQPPSNLLDKYSKWISKGLLKTHENKGGPKDDKYRSKSASFGFDYMDFVVAFLRDKNWFYVISQPKKCWTDEHIDVVFYYLRKKSKLHSPNQYKFITLNCLFKTFINDAHTRYYCSPPDDNLSTQEHIARGAIISAFERSIKNIIKGFSISAGLSWHLVDDVYISMNLNGKFHWVLIVVALKERIIRIYDSSFSTRIKVSSGEIKKLTTMLPSYFMTVVFSINLSEPTGHHWMLTRTVKLACF